MLSKKNIAILGGDERYVQIMKKASAEHARIVAVGYSEEVLQEVPVKRSKLEEVDFHTLDAILLPVEGMDQHGHIHSTYTNDNIVLQEAILRKTPPHCTIYSGTANDILRKLTATTNRSLVVLFERDDIAIANSIPTAEATLQIAMEETNRTIHRANVLITGYGRVGKTMAHLFHQMGATVTVAARKEADIASIRALTYNAVPIHQMNQALQQAEIIINTVPVKLFGNKELPIIDADTLIIDVASKPGGVDFSLAEALQIKTIHALGLPGKVAPKTAGDVLADVLISLWTKDNK